MLSELWSDLRYRARALFRRSEMERELEAELRDHLQREAEKYEREGLSPEEARRRARRAFGRVGRAKEDARAARGTALVESLLQDLRLALRGWRARPAFAVLIIVILALGIGATSGIFSLVDGILLRPLPYAHPERLVQLEQAYPEIGLDAWKLSNENVAMYRDHVSELEAFAGWTQHDVTLLRDGRPRRLSAVRATGEFFRVLGVGPLLGRTFGRDEDGPRPADVAVLSYGLWQEAFGGRRSALGSTLELDGRSYRVIGVMPRGFAFPRPDARVYLPLGLDPTRRFGWYITGIGRLAPGASLARAREDSRAVMWRWAGTLPSLFHGVDPRTTRMTTLVRPLHDVITGDARRPLEVLQAAVLLILLIAVANIALLFSNRAAGRSREMAMRRALGASGPRLARQLLTESLALALVGGALGVGLAFLLVHGVTHAPAVSLPRLGEVGVNGRVLAFTALVSVAAGVGFGLAPVARVLRERAPARLAGAERSGGSAATRRFNGALIVVQLALAAVLLIGAGLVLRSLHDLTNTGLGFEPRGVTTVALPLSGRKFASDSLVARTASEIVDRVRRVPGVREAAISSALPIGGRFNTDGYVVEGHPPPSKTEMETQTVLMATGPGYFRTLGIPLLYGRDFDDRDRADAVPVVIVDRALAARYWKGADALGQRMRLTGDTATWYTIVGVAGNVRDESAAVPPRPHSYFPFAQILDRHAMLTVRTAGAPGPVIAAVRRSVAAVVPGVPLDDVRSLADWVGSSLDTQRITELLLAAFALLAAVLSCVGIYGVMSLYVTDRRREFGVRLAIGAEPGGLVRMVLGEGMTLAVAGVGAGLAGAFVATRWLGSLLYGVSPTDPAVYGILAAALLAVAAASVYLPARRAAGSDPLEALRAE